MTNDVGNIGSPKSALLSILVQYHADDNSCITGNELMLQMAKILCKFRLNLMLCLLSEKLRENI